MKKNILLIATTLIYLSLIGCGGSNRTNEDIDYSESSSIENDSLKLYITPLDINETKAYIPRLDFSKTDIYKNSQMIDVYNTTQLKSAIDLVEPFTTILLHSGDYSSFHKEFSKGKHHITIKAVDKDVVIKPLGSEEGSAFTLPNVARESERVHDINFVGFKVKGIKSSAIKDRRQFIKAVRGKWVDSSGVLHDYGVENPKYGAYNIYIYDITMQDLYMGIYSGLYAHDWTVDNSLMQNSTWSHFWYMMGWHLSVINSTMQDATDDALSLRGHYPNGEEVAYIGTKTTECYGNVFVKDRGSRSEENGFLPKNEWTHLIKNNIFKRISTIRSNENAYVGIGYGEYSKDAICNTEKIYMPPQNIEISDNIFINTKEDINAKNSAIYVDAWSGINNDTLASINGIKIFDNQFIKAKSDEVFIKGDDIEKLGKDDMYGNR